MWQLVYIRMELRQIARDHFAFYYSPETNRIYVWLDYSLGVN